MKCVFLITAGWLLLATFSPLPAQISFNPLNGPFGISVRNMAAGSAGEIFVYSAQGHVYHSTDHGDSWMPASTGMDVLPTDMNGFLPDHAGNMYLKSDTRLYRYDTSTIAWQTVALPPSVGNTLKGVATNPQGHLFVSDGGGRIFRAVSPGAVFEQILDISASNVTATQIAAFNDEHNLFYHYNSPNNRLYHFALNGVEQTALTFQGIPKFIEYNPFTGSAFMSTGSRLWRSKDGGQSWQDIYPVQPYLGSVAQIQFAAAGRSWITNDQGRVFFSDDEGDTWTALNNPNSTLPYSANQISLSSDGVIFLANNEFCTTDVFLRSTDGGISWTSADLQLKHPSTIALWADYAGHLYAGTCRNGLLYSTDKGQNWDAWRLTPQGPEMLEISVGENGVSFAVSTEDSLYVSLNGSQTWKNVTPDGFTESGSEVALSVAPDGTLFCIGMFSVFRSPDYGLHWEQFTDQTIFGILPLQFFYHPNGHIYAAGEGFVFRSDDWGQTWTDAFFDMQPSAFHLAPNGHIWLFGQHPATFEFALYRTTNEGASFAAQGFTNNWIGHITGNAAGDIFVATQNNALWWRKNGAGAWLSLDPGTTGTPDISGLYVDPQQYLYLLQNNDVVYRSLEPTAQANYLRGVVKLDKDNNCQPGAADSPVFNWKVTASGNETFTGFTHSNGKYTLVVPDGTYKVNVVPPNPLWEPCKSNVSVTFSATKDSANIDFAAKTVALCPYPTVAVSTPFLRRCFDNTYFIQYCNEGTAAVSAAQLHVQLDTFFEFLEAALPLAAQNGSFYTFDLGTLEPGQCGNFWIKIKVSCDALPGQEHCLYVHLGPDPNCNMPGLPNLNQTRDCRPNIGSYDPNDKRAFVDGRQEDKRVPPDTPIEYLIRFQNTGTDTAFRVVVEDRLSPLLDVRTVEPLVASHPYTLDIRDGRNLRFVFDPIALPDSSVNEPASHGFVKFRVAQVPGLPLGSQIDNRADIFFDFNEPVRTNTNQLEVTRTTATVRPDDVSGLHIAPNPFGEWTRIDWPELSGTEFYLRLYDPLGRLVWQGYTLEKHVVLERKGLPGGWYVFQVITKDSGIAVGHLEIVEER